MGKSVSWLWQWGIKEPFPGNASTQNKFGSKTNNITSTGKSGLPQPHSYSQRQHAICFHVTVGFVFRGKSHSSGVERLICMQKNTCFNSPVPRFSDYPLCIFSSFPGNFLCFSYYQITLLIFRVSKLMCSEAFLQISIKITRNERPENVFQEFWSGTSLSFSHSKAHYF